MVSLTAGEEKGFLSRLSVNELTQLPQLSGYFNRNLLILHNPKKKVVTTNYVLQTSVVDSI